MATKRYIFECDMNVLKSSSDVEAVILKLPGVKDLRTWKTISTNALFGSSIQCVVVGDELFDQSLPGTPLGFRLDSLELVPEDKALELVDYKPTEADVVEAAAAIASSVKEQAKVAISG